MISSPPISAAFAARRALALTPARVAAAAVAAIGLARLALAFRLQGPVLLPDEYLYTAVSRAVAAGGWPSAGGGPFDFVSVLASVAVAPAWLIHDPALAYRAAQLEGVVAMSLAAVPSFALARRVGLGDRAAAAAAVLAVVVPDLAFGGLLLSEPFAYPLFLGAVLLAVDTLRAPSLRRQALFLAAAAALCLTRAQFAFLPLAYLAAAAAAGESGARLRAVRAQRAVVAALALAAAAVAALGPGSLVGRYAGIASFDRSPAGILHWTAADLVLLLVAAGWLTAPGAAAGLAALLRGRDPAGRAFAALTLLSASALVFEAGLFGAGLGQLEERYVFYAAPLLLVAFLAAAEGGLLAGRLHARAAAGLAAVALVLPLDDPLFGGVRGQSPALLAFEVLARRAGWAAPIAAGGLLAALALAGLALGRRDARRALPGLAAGFALLLGAGCAAVLAPATRGSARAAWTLGAAPPGTSLLAFGAGTPPAEVMKTLFWNPRLGRVLVLGGGRGDAFDSIPVRLAGGGVLRDGTGPVTGPLAFDPAFAELAATGPGITRAGRYVLVRDLARVRISSVVTGWSSRTGRFAPSGSVTVAAPVAGGAVHRTLRLALRSLGTGPAVLRLHCSGGFTKTAVVGRSGLELRLPLDGVGVAGCSYAMTKGVLHWESGRASAFSGRLALGAKAREGGS